jgi:hypothetical protein
VTVANGLRGEVGLPLPGGVRVLRPSFGALVAAEAEVGSLFGLLERAGQGDIRLGEMAALFWHCLAEPGVDRAAFQAELLRAGPAALLPAYRALLTAVFGAR